MIIKCPRCGEEKKHAAKGLCSTCYYKAKPIIKCPGCNEEKKLFVGGLCQSCYKKSRPLIKCKVCGEEKRHHGRGLCSTCYDKYERKIIKCPGCGKEKKLFANDMCKSCYDKSRPVIKCPGCNEEKKLFVGGLCQSCYHKEQDKKGCQDCGLDYDNRKGWNRRRCPECNRAYAHGITRPQYDELPKACMVCGSTEDLCIDHDHETLFIRGVLCRSCNRALGLVNDDKQRLIALNCYLSRKPYTRPSIDTEPLTSTERYGLTKGQIAYLPYRCEVCGGLARAKDHNHKTGIFRGKLCNGCNTCLGELKEDGTRLANAIKYLCAEPFQFSDGPLKSKFKIVAKCTKTDQRILDLEEQWLKLGIEIPIPFIEKI